MRHDESWTGARRGHCDAGRAMHTSFRRAGAAVLCFSALALASSSARADEFQDHLDHATTLAQAERYKEALAELEAAYGQRQSPRLLYMMAKMQQRLGDADKALSNYERFLAADTDGDPRLRSDAQEQVGKLQRLLGKAPPPAAPPTMAPTDPRLEAPPREIKYESKPSVGLIAGGSALFGSAYLGAVVTGSIFLSGNNSNCTPYSYGGYSNNCPGGNQQVASGLLLIPVAGPFLAAIAYRDPAWSINWALVDGVAQVGGVAMIAYAATHPKKVPVYGGRFQILPYAGPSGGGLQASGKF
jgi:tetratricopeptide (TPR) repeat protein